jgi:hypothetical protein
MATTQPGTEYDALMAALLGNVGKVHDEIKRLSPEFRASVAPTMAALNKTMLDAQTSLKSYAKGMEAPIKAAATEQLALTRKAFDETAKATLAAVALDLKKATELHQQALGHARGKRWSWIVLAGQVGLIAGVLGAWLTIYSYKYLHTESINEISAQADKGRVLEAAWLTLDEKAKKTIIGAGKKMVSDMEKLEVKKGQ